MSEEPYTPTTDLRAQIAREIPGLYLWADQDRWDIADAIVASDWFAAEIAKAQADAVTAYKARLDAPVTLELLEGAAAISEGEKQ